MYNPVILKLQARILKYENNIFGLNSFQIKQLTLKDFRKKTITSLPVTNNQFSLYCIRKVFLLLKENNRAAMKFKSLNDLELENFRIYPEKTLILNNITCKTMNLF